MRLQDLVAIFRSAKIQAPDPQMLLNQAGMRERNEARIAQIKEEMGEKWILHPSHKKSKLDAPRPV